MYYYTSRLYVKVVRRKRFGQIEPFPGTIGTLRTLRLRREIFNGVILVSFARRPMLLWDSSAASPSNSLGHQHRNEQVETWPCQPLSHSLMSSVSNYTEQDLAGAQLCCAINSSFSGRNLKMGNCTRGAPTPTPLWQHLLTRTSLTASRIPAL